MLRYTGNPFVDTGLYVISCIAGLSEPEQLTLEKIRVIYGDGSELAKTNARLKSFTMVFGTNGPLTQTGYRPKGQKKILSEKNIKAYTNILSGFLDEMGKERLNYPICEICGHEHCFDFDAVVREGLAKAGVGDKGFKQIGREWFPLAGSPGNDAQTLPSASRSLAVCAKCLFVVHYMPLGLMLMQGRLVCYQSNYSQIAAELTGVIVHDYQNLLDASKARIEMFGKKEGTTAVTSRLISWMRKLDEVKAQEKLPDSASLMVWLFSNAGANPDCEIVEIPNRLLQFLWIARKQGFEHELLSLLKGESKFPEFQLLSCVQMQRDYPRLYPFKTFTGASPGLFALYHQLILNESSQTLKSAQILAQARLNEANSKEQKNLKKSGMFGGNPNEYGRFRKLMIDLTKNGQFNLEIYNQLFPANHMHPLKVEYRGWKVIEYYLSSTNSEVPDFIGGNQQDGENMKPQPKIKQIARLFFDDYIKRHGIEHFQKNIIENFSRTNPSGLQWLRNNVYLNLAKEHPGFTLEDWDEFVQDENGQPQASELLFQLRLELANLYREYTQNPTKS